MPALRFDNALMRQLPGDAEQGPRRREVLNALWSSVMPTPVAAPHVLAVSREMVQTLGLSDDDVRDPAFAHVFGGNALWPGMQPFATNYGGHQFGAWAGQLGDGRAISLGEVIDAQQRRWELQLKGAGPTPYSRSADGRAVLRSSIREFLCSEAMHHLGVPTTRALSLVVTGEAVVRDMFYDGHPQAEAGAIVCRVAPSFLRFGHFELPASRGEIDLLRQLADFCIARDFPELLALPAGPARYAPWFAEVARRTAVLMGHWMRVGFVHGVMNTDNLSILGLTIDYGPYGWIDDYNPDWTPNTTDAAGGRYRFGWQPRIAYWNLTRLAHALSPLFEGVEALQAGLQVYMDTYYAADRDNVARKLGLAEAGEDDLALMARLHDVMQAGEIDMTLFFRALIALDPAQPSLSLFDAERFDTPFYDAARRAAVEPALQAWLVDYTARVAADPLDAAQRRERMRRANPRYVLRNYLAQEVIDRAEAGDVEGIGELLDVMRQPYDDQPGRERFAARRPDWARDKAGCSMLSCSS